MTRLRESGIICACVWEREGDNIEMQTQVYIHYSGKHTDKEKKR